MGCIHTQTIPVEAWDLGFLAGATKLVWMAPPGAAPGTGYDVMRGLVSELPVGNGAALEETCFAADLHEQDVMDSDTPASTLAFWYLVRARDPSCGPGRYGFEGRHGQPAAERVTTLCP